MNEIDEVRTARLNLSRIGLHHLDAIRLLHTDADVMATLGGVRTVEQTRLGLEALEQHWRDHDFGPWIAHDGRSGAFVGMGGLRQVVVEGVKEIEIGYALMPERWGQGLATELAQAATDVAFRVLRLPALVSFALPTNVRSRRVMEKVGFRYDRDVVYKGHPQVLYRIAATQWSREASHSINVRSATIDDSEPIARLVSDLGYRTSASQMRQRLEAIARDDSYDTFVACDDGQIVGFVGARIGRLYEDDGQYGQIMALAVADGHERRGVGRMLIQAAESALVERGARTLVVTSGSHRVGAHAFYERCGYAITGRRYMKSAS